MTERELLILLTNDDGSEAKGLLAIKDELAGFGRIVVVAPYEERSAVSHALTIRVPIQSIEVATDHYAITGTPADCVLFALRRVLPRRPDLVISGINHGANLAEDCLYSGTVAGAREAALHGIRSIAVSLASGKNEADFRPAARFTSFLIQELFPDRIPRGTYLNVNVPEGSPEKYRFTRQGARRSLGQVDETIDRRGRIFYQISLDSGEWIADSKTDVQCLQDGEVSVTPMSQDLTDYRVLQSYQDDDE